MGFEKFGRVNYTNEAKTADFVAYLEQGKIMATRCRSCGSLYFPPKMDCSKCLLSDVEWVEINANGRLITYTLVNYGPRGFEDDTPYILAVGEFGNDVQIFGRLSQDTDKGDIKIGMELRITPVKLPNGRVTYEFQVASKL